MCYQFNTLYEEVIIIIIIIIYLFIYLFIYFPVALRPNTGYGPLILDVSRSHTTTHHSR